MNNKYVKVISSPDFIPKCPGCYKGKGILGQKYSTHYELGVFCEECGYISENDPICSVEQCTRRCASVFIGSELFFYNECGDENCAEPEMSPFGCNYPNCTNEVYFDLEDCGFPLACSEHSIDKYFICEVEGCDQMKATNGTCTNEYYCQEHGN